MPCELTVVKLTALAKVNGSGKLQSPVRLTTLTEQVSVTFMLNVSTLSLQCKVL